MNLKYPKIYPRYDLSDFQNWLQLGYCRKSHESHNLGDFFGYSTRKTSRIHPIHDFHDYFIDESEIRNVSEFSLMFSSFGTFNLVYTLNPFSKIKGVQHLILL